MREQRGETRIADAIAARHDHRSGPGAQRRGSKRSHEGVGKLRFSLVVGEDGGDHGAVVPRRWMNRRAIRYTDREAIVCFDQVRRPQMTGAPIPWRYDQLRRYLVI